MVFRYTLENVIGRNCRFLQGPATDPRVIQRLSRAITAGNDASVTILNYRADGSTFWNQLFVKTSVHSYVWFLQAWVDH